MRRTHFLLVAVVAIAPCVAACEAAPRVRNVEMGPVDTGANSVEAVRRQLEGTWTLVSLVVYDAAGQAQPAQAKGRLTYDKYGTMAITGTIAAGPHIDPAALNLKGRVTIDPDKKMLVFGGITAGSPDARRVDPKLDASNVRYYEFDNDLLKTTTKDASGATTATLTWKKAG
jgi:hypothetical protein